jgi:lipocalin-like protein
LKKSNIRTIGLVAGAILLFCGCESWNEKKLCGKWQAASVTENGMPVDVALDEIGFEFSTNGFYNFHSTIDYREAGTFSLRGDLLYTLDTINEASSEKTVKVLTLTADSLAIKMHEDGHPRILTLYKIH